DGPFLVVPATQRTRLQRQLPGQRLDVQAAAERVRRSAAVVERGAAAIHSRLRSVALRLARGRYPDHVDGGVSRAVKPSRLAIVFCAHHKPWLMMASLLTLVSQESWDADLFFAYNVGDGSLRRECYREYQALAAGASGNVQ